MVNTKKPFSNDYVSEHNFEKGFFSSNDTYIHPTSLIGPNVTLAPGVKIGPYCILLGTISIGKGTRLYGHVTIGFPAQDIGTHESLGTLHIGERCHIREFVTIHASKYPTGKTIIGNDCYIMNFSHIGHDVTLENNVILINNVNLGGHSYIERNVMLMANSAVHQFCRIGAFSALAPFSATRQDLPPYCLFTGHPAGFGGLNAVGLRRAGFSHETVSALKTVTRLFYQEKKLFETIKNTVENNDFVHTFLSFIESSKRGVSRRIMPSTSGKERSHIIHEGDT